MASGLYQITPWLEKIYFWSNGGYFQVEAEQLIYPWQSLLAEFGGVLGLFLGFSFMTVWDGFKNVALWIMELKKDDNV